MSIDNLIIEKAKHKIEVIDTMGIPLAKALAIDAFMGELITILTAQDAAITALQADMANRMLCTKYKDTE